MADVILRYMTVSLDLQPTGINLVCWMSTVDFWIAEKSQFPFPYTYVGDNCTWIMHANSELTAKIISMVAETADRICEEQSAANYRRKVANR